jgi:hypothetical protein
MDQAVGVAARAAGAVDVVVSMLVTAGRVSLRHVPAGQVDRLKCRRTGRAVRKADGRRFVTSEPIDATRRLGTVP